MRQLLRAYAVVMALTAEAALILLPLILLGCTRSPAVTVCPPTVAYTQAQEQALHAELSSRDGPLAERWVEDYVALRAAARACAQP